MKSKKALLVAAFGAIVATALSSCAGSNGTSDVDASLPSDDPTSEVNIEFWHCLGHEKSSNLDKIVASFNTKYAGKYHVEALKIAGDYDSLADAIKTKTAANEIPALTMGYPDSFSAYMGQRIENSAILRLDNFISDATYGYSKEEIADFVPAFYNEGSAYQFKGQWSMPMYKSTEIMYYNMNYFYGDNQANALKFQSNSEYQALITVIDKEAANVTDAHLTELKTWCDAHEGYTYSVPTTWEDMITTARKMKTDLKTEKYKSVDAFFPVGYDSDSNLMITQLAMKGIPYTTNDNISKAEDHILFNNDQTKGIVTDLVGLYQEGVLITKGLLGGSKYTNEYFTAGDCVMTIGSTGGSSYNVSSNFRVGLAAVPTPSGVTAKYIQQGPSICFFNNDDPYIHKGAWLFYKELADKTNNVKLALQNSYDPIRESSFATTEYSSWIAKKDTDLKYAIPAETAKLRNNYMTSVVFPGSDTARTEIGKILTYVCANKYSVDEAVTKAYNETIKNTKMTYAE